MQELAAVISLVLFFVIWWLIAKKLKPSKGLVTRNILGALGGFVAMIAVMAFFIEDTDKNKEESTTVATADPESVNATPAEKPIEIVEETQETEANEAAATPEIVEAVTLNLTPEKHLKNFSSSLKTIGLPFKISTTPEIKEGSVNDVFTVMLDNSLALSGTIDKASGEVMSTTLIGSGDGTEESGYIIMLAATASFMAAADATSESGKDKYSKIFFDLMKEVGKSSSPSNTVNGIKFAIIPMGQMGTWFISEAVE